MLAMDPIDTEIVRRLQDNARETQADIARAVGLAPSAVLERIRKLEGRRLIQGYAAELNAKALGLGMLAFVAVRTEEAGSENRIAHALSECAEVCACDFTACCDVSQPTVSHHLKVLRDAGWIAGERRGTWIWYSLRPEAVTRFRELAGGLTPTAPMAIQSRRLPVLEARA